jgi:hypothetical protein
MVIVSRRIIRQKGELAKILVLGPVYPADIHFWTSAGFESGCTGYRIKFYVD